MYCKYCNKECKNKNSLAQHEIRCKENPNHITINNSGKNNPMYGKTAWNKGLTRETDSRVNKIANKIHIIAENKHLRGEKYTPGFAKNKELENNRRLKISNIMKEKNLVNNFKHKKVDYYYNGIHFISSYELFVAKELDANNVKWIIPNRFKYYEENNMKNPYHYYTPDFYLPEFDIYLDPKNDFLINNPNPHFGYCDIDKIHWVELFNNIKIIVLDKNNLNWPNIYNKILEYNSDGRVQC